jgi:hypothetical protein
MSSKDGMGSDRRTARSRAQSPGYATQALSAAGSFY